MEAEAAALQARNWNEVIHSCERSTIPVLVLYVLVLLLPPCEGLPHLDGVGTWNVEHVTLKSSPYNCDRKLQQNSFCCLRISTGETASERWNAEALEDVGFGKQDKSSES